MIKLNQSKRLGAAFEELRQNILTNQQSISILARRKLASEQLDALLQEEYASFGLEPFSILQSHELITGLPFNQTVDLSFLKESPTYQPYVIPTYKCEPANYAIMTRDLKAFTPLVRFDQDISLPMICEDGVGWMTPTLFEETTMAPAVERAHGHVLAVGLGVGFFPFNCLLKDSVQKVTILEYNSDIIALFKAHILPQFPRAKDVEIIQGNAFECLTPAFIADYDYTFVDIWRNNDDGTVMLSDLLKAFEPDSLPSIDFWVEDAILDGVKAALFTYLYQSYQGALSRFLTGSVSQSRAIDDFITFDKIHAYFKTKDLFIHNRHDLLEVLNDKTLLRDLLRSF